MAAGQEIGFTDTRLHAFVNDDDSQFVDIWRNENSTITMKVSNGKPSYDMNLRIKVYFRSGNQVIGEQEYRNIYCPAPAVLAVRNVGTKTCLALN